MFLLGTASHRPPQWPRVPGAVRVPFDSWVLYSKALGPRKWVGSGWHTQMDPLDAPYAQAHDRKAAGGPAWAGVRVSLQSCANGEDGLGLALPSTGTCGVCHRPGVGRRAVGTAARLTISVHTHDEVVTHGPGLAQLVGVAIMYHVVAVESAGLSSPCWGCSLVPLSVPFPQKARQEATTRTAPRVPVGLSDRGVLSSPYPQSLGPGSD